ncbi:aspartate ammonia-lyase [Miniphocaeibacter halophilus]|uniref:Aspartate ammonia-lyase n=1 Tax=Miniphocaeibacter halophilus TaxID=2931922 RepID=A0AC61MNE6_9FIRM|nr:aspartate ammonia-lyase [Miniphocaeibacter halophilus]QQK07087.1 aspartate ammonia-lyase [Miniphocaeibacter halophilus]
MDNFRIESDSVGELKIPTKAYYGVQTLRAKNNFNITGRKMHKDLIISLAEIKKASAVSNIKTGQLDTAIGTAIIKACDEIINGKYHEEFIVDPIQGGAGTSANMNANEVIANIALEILGNNKGNYSLIHPNDHVNMSQSTNDVFPTAGKMTIIKLLKNLKKEINNLYKALIAKSEEFDDVIKMGRTQLEDAIPITLGQEFSAYSQAIKRDLKRTELAIEEMEYVNMGATAIGTGLNAKKDYIDNIVSELDEISNLNLKQAPNLIDGTQNLDCFTIVSGYLKALAVNLSKISNDLRLMNSGPRTGLAEITLPPKQNGSSIMPGKINPVIPEVVNQISFNVIGNDTTITMACEAGQLELNAFEPIIFYNLFESIETLTYGIKTFTDNAIKDLVANRENCKKHVSNSIGLITAVNPYIGYQKSATIAKEALKSGKTIRDLLTKEHIFSNNEIDNVLDPYKMIKPKN